MVKLLLYLGTSFLILSILTLKYYDNSDDKLSCSHRILTSSSFHIGVGELIKEKYKKKYRCDLNFAVVNGANLISSLFNKQPKQYDVLMGLDFFQIQKLSDHLIYKFEDEPPYYKFSYKNSYFAYDESPITFFLRDSKQSQFIDLNHFLVYLNSNNMSVAIPLKTTSVLGALFEKWGSMSNFNLIEVPKSKTIKFVKSWSESFGLFERKIVDGFLSFETSEIYFLKNSNIKKIIFKTGHPNLKEYMAFSKSTKMDKNQKVQFIDFMYSEDIQKLILEKNYMWPVNLKKHKYSELRTLELLDIELN